MSIKDLEKAWEDRRKNLPSSFITEDLEQSLVEYAEKAEKEQTIFMLEHSQHGNVILKHISISEIPVELSTTQRSWDFPEPRHEGSGIKKWEYFLVCQNCHKSIVVVDGNTPNEFKSI